MIVTSGDGLYESTIEDGRFIYRGSNPNNYIYLKEDGVNNVLYRIVSYEADGTIKVVRDESIGSMSWDNSGARKSDVTNETYCTSEYGCNVWGNQSNSLYNGSPLGDSFHYSYYESADSTSFIDGNSGTVTSDSTLNTFLNSKTRDSASSWQPAIFLDNYIENHLWDVGGIYYTGIYSYLDKGIEMEREEIRQLKWSGKIALLYITEFVESSTNPSCTSVATNTVVFGRTGGPCNESNWLFKGVGEWSLTASPNNSSCVWYVSNSGDFNFRGNPGASLYVRPTFYLKSGITLKGSGTLDEPYSIS